MSYPRKPIGDFVLKVTKWDPRKLPDADDFLYIDLSSVDKDKKSIEHELVEGIATSDAPSRARQIVKTGDVLVATVRPNLNGVAVVSTEFDGATASTGYCVLRPDQEKLDSRYLFHWVRSSAFIKSMIKQATGANYPAVSDSIIKNDLFPAPPLPEQKRIAAILDKADQLRQKRQQAINLADEFLRSVFLEMFGDPVTNPKGWEIKTFADLGNWTSGGTPSRTKPDYFTGNIDWYSARELNTRYLNGSIEKITEEALRSSAAKLVPAGSMFVGMYDTAAFKISILTKDSASNQACANIVVNKNVDIEWFYTYVEISKEHYLRQRRGVRRQNLNLGMIKAFELPLPPIEQQQKFAEVAKKVVRVRNKCCATGLKSDNLFNSLSQKAFAGQL